MKRILLVGGLVIAASSQVFAQTGSTVREDRIWNYSLESSYDGFTTWTESDPGYHFKGTEEVNGKKYMVFRDSYGEAMALMRQEGKKIYTPLRGNENWPDGHEEAGSENLPTEILLYDFDAKEGESYYSITTLGDIVNIVNVTVTETSTIEVNGESYICQRLSNHYYNKEHTYAVVEGVGPSEGYLFEPQGSPLVAGKQTWVYISTVSDASGNVIFTDSVFDFGTDGVDSIADADGSIVYENGVVTAAGNITLYDMGGKCVAEGIGEVSTSGLVPGLYIATAKDFQGVRSFKIRVKDL